MPQLPEYSEQGIEQRLNALQQQFVGPEFIEALYGLEFDAETDLGKRFSAWAELHYREGQEVFDGDQIHRWRLETYFQNKELLPVKWAAVRLGMTRESFEEVIETLEGEHLLEAGTITDGVIREADVKGLRDNFESLRRRTFAGVQDFCGRLHEAIDDEFDIEVEPLHCITSRVLGEGELLYAQGFDSLTDEPVSSRYEHWLETGKPMYLSPDSCATSTLVRFEELLDEYLFTPAKEEIVDPVKDWHASAHGNR